MKYILPVICSVILAGCNNASDTVETNGEPVTAEKPAPVEENVTEPTATEAAPSETTTQTSDTPKAVEPKTTETAAVDGASVFNQKCVSCHGSKAEKSALGKSQIIAGWEEQKIIDVLKGYQNGTYGKEMKMIMQGQAKGLDDAQLKAVAHYISTL